MQDPLVDFLTKPCLAHSATVAPKHFFRYDSKKTCRLSFYACSLCLCWLVVQWMLLCIRRVNNCFFCRPHCKTALHGYFTQLVLHKQSSFCSKFPALSICSNCASIFLDVANFTIDKKLSKQINIKTDLLLNFLLLMFKFWWKFETNVW